ncbi:MAG TPA: DUF3105 domain-containing protein [Solirubrobacterales bacterium]|jgi:Protein of unknown function (DUF3105)|nr:DUF3105 domain-containing protein [Solirubrobacterales bacterium]
MASRKEEKERLRQQRLAAERAAASSGQRRLLLGYVVAGLLALAVVAGLVVVIVSGSSSSAEASTCENAHIKNSGGTFRGLDPDCREGTPPPTIKVADLQISAQKAGCELRLDLPNEGNTHVPNSTPVDYKTTPPTSGNHNPVPIDDGAYRTPVTDDTSQPTNIRNEVHSMEHGRIEIHYKPSLPENEQLALKGVFDADPNGMLLYPDPNMPYDVAVTSWQNMAVCPNYNEGVLDLIRNFRDTYRGNGPEQQIPIDLP